MATAVTSRSQEASLGKSVATRVRRLISLFTRSSALVVRSLDGRRILATVDHYLHIINFRQ